MRCFPSASDYNFKSGQYSTWTESSWAATAMDVQVFLIPSKQFEVWVTIYIYNLCCHIYQKKYNNWNNGVFIETSVFIFMQTEKMESSLYRVTSLMFDSQLIFKTFIVIYIKRNITVGLMVFLSREYV